MTKKIHSNKSSLLHNAIIKKLWNYFILEGIKIYSIVFRKNKLKLKSKSYNNKNEWKISKTKSIQNKLNNKYEKPNKFLVF